jgi:hypothetical protein
MEGTSYRIVLLGVKPDHDPQEVKQQLARTFHSTPEMIEQLLSKLPVAVKANLNHQTAMKYRAAISKAGGVCRVEPVAGLNPVPALPRRPLQTLKTCPNCGYAATASDDPLLTAHDGRGECSSCGIIVSKFNQARCVPRSDISPQTSCYLSARSKKRSRWFRVRRAAAVLAGLVILGAIGHVTLRKVAMNRFYAQVDAYDQKIHSLATSDEATRAIEDLYRLYDSAAESVPGFTWRGFKPNGKFGKYYTRDDIETIGEYLRPRKEALMNSMREAAANGETLYGTRLEDIGENLRQYEFCVIGRLRFMDKYGRQQMAILETTAGITCDRGTIGPLSARRTEP